MNRCQIEKMFLDDQQGYLFADLVRIINGGCEEEVTEDHIEALRAENKSKMEARSWTPKTF